MQGLILNVSRALIYTSRRPHIRNTLLNLKFDSKTYFHGCIRVRRVLKFLRPRFFFLSLLFFHVLFFAWFIILSFHGHSSYFSLSKSQLCDFFSFPFFFFFLFFTLPFELVYMKVLCTFFSLAHSPFVPIFNLSVEYEMLHFDIQPYCPMLIYDTISKKKLSILSLFLNLTNFANLITWIYFWKTKLWSH